MGIRHEVRKRYGLSDIEATTLCSIGVRGFHGIPASEYSRDGEYLRWTPSARRALIEKGLVVFETHRPRSQRFAIPRYHLNARSYLIVHELIGWALPEGDWPHTKDVDEQGRIAHGPPRPRPA